MYAMQYQPCVTGVSYPASFVSTTVNKLLLWCSVWISCPAFSSCGCDWCRLLIPVSPLVRTNQFLRVLVPHNLGTILLFESSGLSALMPFALFELSVCSICRELALIFSRTFCGAFLAYPGSLDFFFHVVGLGTWLWTCWFLLYDFDTCQGTRSWLVVPDCAWLIALLDTFAEIPFCQFYILCCCVFSDICCPMQHFWPPYFCLHPWRCSGACLLCHASLGFFWQL